MLSPRPEPPLFVVNPFSKIRSGSFIFPALLIILIAANSPLFSALILTYLPFSSLKFSVPKASTAFFTKLTRTAVKLSSSARTFKLALLSTIYSIFLHSKYTLVKSSTILMIFFKSHCFSSLLCVDFKARRELPDIFTALEIQFTPFKIVSSVIPFFSQYFLIISPYKSHMES